MSGQRDAETIGQSERVHGVDKQASKSWVVRIGRGENPRCVGGRPTNSHW